MSLIKNILYAFLLLLIFNSTSHSQGSPYYTGGFKIKFNEQENKYIRLIAWTQFQANFSDDIEETDPPINFQLRRARFLAYGQIVDNFLVLVHFGVNSLNRDNMHPLGTEGTSQLFMHDAWAQYNISENHVIGGGLHYFNSISRLNSQGTLNLMTMDNYRPSWSNLGLSDQFARHIGVFAKGTFFERLQYQVAMNSSMKNGLDQREINEDFAVYRGAETFGKNAAYTYGGYLTYNFLNVESNFLPYRVGSYLGTQDLFNIGAGIFHQPNAAVRSENGTLNGEHSTLFALDVFYDRKIGKDNASITLYSVYQSNDYGTDYFLGPYATGDFIYGHIGYLFKGDFEKMRYQPYVSFGSQNVAALQSRRNTLGLGINFLQSGHNSKITLEYKNESFLNERINQVNLQAMIYL